VSFGFTMVGLLVLGVIAMGDAVLHCDTFVRGRPNDGTTASVWLNWAWDRTGGGPFQPVQFLTGGNLGDVLWRPLAVVNLAILLPMWAFTRVVDHVCAYNLTFLLGYVTSGLGMWALVRHLVRSRAAATVIPLIFAFSSFSQLKAEWGHPSGVFLVLFPLLVLALLRLWECVTVGRVLAVGACWGALPYIDGYHLSFAALTVVGVVGGMTVAVLRRDGRGSARWLFGRLAATAAAGAAALVVLVPWALTLLSDFGAINEQTTRTAEDASRYSARLWEYLLPSPRHPMAPDGYTTWRIEHMHRSNFAETALYLGMVPLALAVIGVLVARRAGRGSEGDLVVTETEPRVDRRVEVAGLLGLVAVGVVFSLDPEAEVFGVPLPMPAELIRAVMPQVRVLSRLVILVLTGLLALAAIGLDSVLARRPHRPRRLTVAGGVAVLALFESLTFAPWSPPTWSYERTPAVFVSLGADDSVDTVALYPMLRAGENGDVLSTFQPVLDKVLVNPASDTGATNDPADVVRGLAALDDPQTVPGLRMLGTDVVVVTDRGAEVVLPDDAPDGLLLESTISCAPPVLGVPARDGDGRDCLATRVYRVEAGPTAVAVVALGSGWRDFEADGWGGRRPASDGAQLEVVSAGSAADVAVRFQVIAVGAGRLEVVDAAGASVASVDVGTEPATVAFRTGPGRTLELRLDGVDQVWATGFDADPA
jgi:hypothetical protein